mgnify:CR=1 FL=1
MTTTWSYDTNNRVTGIQTRDSSNTLLAAHAYTLNNLAMPTAEARQLQVYDDATDTWTLKSIDIDYTLDQAHRLTTEVHTEDMTETYREELTYDNVGNRTQRVVDGVTTSNTYNARNQLVSSVTGGVTTSYTYDKNGNLVQTTDGSTTKDMTYDQLNRMTSWTNGTNTETTTYIGAKWHRASYAANGGSPTYFLYDGANVVADLVEGTDPAPTTAPGSTSPPVSTRTSP